MPVLALLQTDLLKLLVFKRAYMDQIKYIINFFAGLSSMGRPILYKILRFSSIFNNKIMDKQQVPYR